MDPLLYKGKLTDGTEVHHHVDSIMQKNNHAVMNEVIPEFEGPVFKTSLIEH